MPTGDWCKGRSKDSDEKINRMAENVSKALRDPELRRRLDAQKRRTPEEIRQLIQNSNTSWHLTDDLTSYVRQSEKNLKCKCSEGHEQLNSLNNIVNNVRCTICFPHKNKGSLNPAYKNIDIFYERMMKKFGADAFKFDSTTYDGLYSTVQFSCSTCLHEFKKAPRALLNEKYGCPACALRARGDSQRRTKRQFLSHANEVHGSKFTYRYTPKQTFGNADTIEWTCNDCNSTQTQSVANHLGGNGCSTCSEKKKHTTQSFIEKSIRIWGLDQFDYQHVEYINNKTPVTLICRAGHTFRCSPSNHFSLKGCPNCSIKRFVSIGETEWLNSLAIPVDNRNKWITVNDQRFNVDALINETIYEYYGDFWHGNPKRFSPDMINVHSSMSMKEHYEHTLAREQLLREAGYVVITMWESDWMQLRKTRRGIKTSASTGPRASETQPPG